MRRRRPPLEQVGKDPDYRFTLANERTFLAWIRTALALVAAGVAVVQLVPEFRVPGGTALLGGVLTGLGALVAAAAYPRWERNERAMRTGRPLPPSPVPRVVGAGLLVVAVLALALVLLARRPL